MAYDQIAQRTRETREEGLANVQRQVFALQKRKPQLRILAVPFDSPIEREPRDACAGVGKKRQAGLGASDFCESGGN